MRGRFRAIADTFKELTSAKAFHDGVRDRTMRQVVPTPSVPLLLLDGEAHESSAQAAIRVSAAC